MNGGDKNMIIENTVVNGDTKKEIKIDYFVFANILYKYNEETDDYDKCFTMTNDQVKKFLRGDLILDEN